MADDENPYDPTTEYDQWIAWYKQHAGSSSGSGTPAASAPVAAADKNTPRDPQAIANIEKTFPGGTWNSGHTVYTFNDNGVTRIVDVNPSTGTFGNVYTPTASQLSRSGATAPGNASSSGGGSAVTATNHQGDRVITARSVDGQNYEVREDKNGNRYTINTTTQKRYDGVDALPTSTTRQVGSNGFLVVTRPDGTMYTKNLTTGKQVEGYAVPATPSSLDVLKNLKSGQNISTTGKAEIGSGIVGSPETELSLGGQRTGNGQFATTMADIAQPRVLGGSQIRPDYTTDEARRWALEVAPILTAAGRTPTGTMADLVTAQQIQDARAQGKDPAAPAPYMDTAGHYVDPNQRIIQNKDNFGPDTAISGNGIPSSAGYAGPQGASVSTLEDLGVPAFDEGGGMQIDEPMVAVGLNSGRPRFTIGEKAPAQQEAMTVRPESRMSTYDHGAYPGEADTTYDHGDYSQAFKNANPYAFMSSVEQQKALDARAQGSRWGLNENDQSTTSMTGLVQRILANAQQRQRRPYGIPGLAGA